MLHFYLKIPQVVFINKPDTADLCTVIIVVADFESSMIHGTFKGIDCPKLRTFTFYFYLFKK